MNFTNALLNFASMFVCLYWNHVDPFMPFVFIAGMNCAAFIFCMLKTSKEME